MPGWILYSMIVMVSWGVLGIFQKLATDRISPESVLFWMIVGFVFFEPFIYPGKQLFSYPRHGIIYGLMSGFLSNLGAFGLYAALRKGGKASVVVPLVSLYPLIVIAVAPFLLHESLTLTQTLGSGCALTAVALLSA